MNLVDPSQGVYFRLQAFARNAIRRSTAWSAASALFSGLAASSKRRRGSFAEFGAINAGHAAQMREPEIKCDVDNPFTRPGIQKPCVEMLEANIEQNL